MLQILKVLYKFICHYMSIVINIPNDFSFIGKLKVASSMIA